MNHLLIILKPATTMLKDNHPSYLARPTDLIVIDNFEINRIFEFIDNNISSFYKFFVDYPDSDKENWISNVLIRHFQLCNQEQGGYLPYDFSKNPPQAATTNEADIGVYVNSRSVKQIPILEFEAKRFSNTSNNKEYVSGGRGGIERFKKGHHASHLTVCGMFGYVQSKSSQEWITKVNSWISDLSKNNTDPTIDWSETHELLVSNVSFPKVEKLLSHHSRIQSNDKITLWHYFIELN